MTRPCRIPALASLGILAACSSGGSGGSGDTEPPVITAAAFVGVGPFPAAGDTLILFFSENVGLVQNAVVDDVDVMLSSGSLGAVGAPTLNDPRSVSVPLGAGVNFDPGTTTVAFDTGNDAVMDQSGNLGRGGQPVTITAGDGDFPTITDLTLNAVDASLNGTGPAGGTLQTPPNGFTIDFDATDPTSAVTQASITASTLVTVNGAPVAPGGDLASDLALTQTGDSFSFLVPNTVVFSASLTELTVQVTDATGMVSAAATFTFLVRTLDDSVRPFETSVNPSQVWFLDTSRDEESYNVNLANVVTPVEVTQGANGRSDLLDLFLVIGLHSLTPIPAVQPGMDSNEVVTDQLQTAVLGDLGALFPGVNVSFTFTMPGGTPPVQAAVAYNSASYSRICIAGAEDPAGTSGVLGVAIFDPHNSTQNNNCLLDFSGNQRLGVFIHTMVNVGIGPPSASLFRVTYDPLTPARGGTPIGDDLNDGARLQGVLLDGRTTTINNAINRMARFIAVVTAHETGHSMGLVVNGPMPTGLYGNDTANFPGSASGHIHIGPPSFPNGSRNVMSPALSFSESQSFPFTRFNSLNLAYFLETVLYN